MSGINREALDAVVDHPDLIDALIERGRLAVVPWRYRDGYLTSLPYEDAEPMYREVR